MQPASEDVDMLDDNLLGVNLTKDISDIRYGIPKNASIESQEYDSSPESVEALPANTSSSTSNNTGQRKKRDANQKDKETTANVKEEQSSADEDYHPKSSRNTVRGGTRAAARGSNSSRSKIHVIENEPPTVTARGSSSSNAPLGGPHWSDEQLTGLEDHENYYTKQVEYYRKMVEYINELRDHGKDQATVPKVPTPPKTPLSKILKPAVQVNDKLSRLQEYLKQKIVNNPAKNKFVEIEVKSDRLKDFETPIKAGLISLKHGKVVLLQAKLSYAKLLSSAQVVFKNEKKSKVHEENWYKWLANVTDCIDTSYFRKLIAMHKILLNYPKFKNLCISFDELYKKRNDIKKLLLDENLAREWK